jgi:PAS domain S-box-containing protein
MLIQEDYFKNIFNTVREAILILDENMKVLSANRSFFKIFKVDPANTIGILLYDLGNGQWDIPYLRVLLEDVLPKNDTVDDYEIAHNFESIGHKIMLLNACKIREKNNDLPIILLAIEDITERKEIEAGLEKTRKELVIIKKTADEASEFAQSVINTVREPLISLDQDLRVVTVSRSFYEFFKVKPEETVGQLIYDLGNKQWDIPKLRELLENILPQKTTFDNYEVEHDFASIGRRIMLLNARQIERGSGKERTILLAIEDITERKQIEESLIESEARYRRVFETASDGIVLLEKREGTIIQTNPAAEKMLGYSEEECIGRNLQDIGVSLYTNDFSAIMHDLNRSGILNYTDVMVKTRSGRSIDTDIYMVDRAKLAQCNIRDVTERKLADEALKEEKTFIDNALNTLEDVFFVFDLEGRFLRWNKTMKAVSGYSDTEIALMKATDFFLKDDIARVSGAIGKAVKEGSASVDAMLVTKDGRQIPYEFRASLLRDQTGNLIGISGVGRDLTERNKLEAKLLHSQKMEAIGTLTGGIAHDFNNILNVIMGYGSMILDTLEADSPSKAQMNEVLAAAERAALLTNRLLVFSRKQAVQVKPVNVNEIVIGIQKMLIRTIGEDIDFQVDLADTPLVVMADAGQMEQVLMNLAVNARDAISGGGRLTINTAVEEVDDEYVAAYGYGKPGRYALITIADTGCGMDAETQKKIFEPFFTTKDVGEGTGLGLAISYGIIKQHSGYIKVYSEPGQGTLFKIYLPLIDDSALPEKKTEAAVPARGGNETVLVVEDDAALRKLSRIVLESCGYSVITAEDGEDAIAKFIENREMIDLVVLDMIMPKKNGKEVSEALRKASPRIKILFVSGYTMNLIKSKELTASSLDFIHKPVRPQELLKKVREVLDKSG